MADWASLLDGLNTHVVEAFGREITYLPQGADPVAVRGIVQAAHQGEESSPGVYAYVFVHLADLPEYPARGDEVQIDGSVYAVYQVEAEGQGGATLALHVR